MERSAVDLTVRTPALMLPELKDAGPRSGIITTPPYSSIKHYEVELSGLQMKIAKYLPNPNVYKLRQFFLGCWPINMAFYQFFLSLSALLA